MKELISFVDTNFQLNQNSDLVNSMDELERLLAERILFYIRTDMDKLLQILYRIDVDDKLSSQAFDLGEINQVAKKLSKLIIERQVQKYNYAKGFEGD